MQTFWSSEPRHWLALFRSLDSTEANEIPANNRNHSLKLSPLNTLSSVIDIFVQKQHELTLKEANIGDSIK